MPLLEAIGAGQFSKYQRLIRLIRAEWGWRGDTASDRLVIFTGRRETQRFLMKRLAEDLGLEGRAVVSLDGAMPDVEQTAVVEQFAQEGQPVRILVATEVASEGLNLHYHSHRLVHFDIPWSLMTLQQRNGRIDRYGQRQQPQIRFMLTRSRSDGMGDAEKIIRLLKTKDEQAQRNIGDPAVFLRKFDAGDEEQALSEAFEQGRVDSLEEEMDANARPYLEQGRGDSLLEELFGTGAGSGDPGNAPPPAAQPEVKQGKTLSLFPSLRTYVNRALEQLSEQMERRGEPLDLRIFEEQERLEITPPRDLQRRYERYPKELRPARGQRLVLSTEVAALQRALEQARRKDSARPELEYLWDLHPLVDWLADRGQLGFARHCAPVLTLSSGLDCGEVVMVLQGSIPNRKGIPVVQEWVGVRFDGSGLLAEVEPFEAVAQRLGLGGQLLANRGAAIPESLKAQQAMAVEKARTYLLGSKQRWEAGIQPALNAQRERLQRLRARQVERLNAKYAADRSMQKVKDKKRAEDMKQIDERFQDHERFMSETMTIKPDPYLKLVAVLRGEA